MDGSLSEKVESSPQPQSQPLSAGDNGFAKRLEAGEPVETPLEGSDILKMDSKLVKVEPAPDDDPYKHLPPAEAEILRRQVYVADVPVGVKTLYRYATQYDLIIVVISGFSAIIGGAALPLMTVIFGQLAGTFQDFFQQKSTRDEFDSTMTHYVLFFVYLAIAEFVLVYISTVGFIYTGEHISGKIREKYLAACLSQNIGFFDELGAGEVTTRITADTNLVQDGISEKIGLTVSAVATFLTVFVIGFIKYWKLTLILMSTIVSIGLVMGGLSRFLVKFNKTALQSYGQGGTVAEEVLSSIRNATAFGTQDKLARQYNKHLIEAERWGFKAKGTLGVMVGLIFCILYLNYGLAFWQGSRFLVDGETGLSSILTILLAVMIGAFSLGNVAPNIQAFTTAFSAAVKIYSTIDRASPLDPTSEVGKKLDRVEGTVELRNVKHIYPSRPDVVVMEDVSLIIPAGKMTALVGASGSGKSTVVGLVERFYDTVGGNVFLDGVDITTLNLRWLRQQMSLVSQEPTLFGTTIYENIRHGLIGTEYENESEERQNELIFEAAKMANAHDFITTLPEGYETNVGERGFLLSGGQKQRVAIARAVVKDPKILLLDEATSALDTKSEGIVQAALEVAAAGRTTISIAHRLSTIRDADNIVVMAEGRIIEQGTHDDLLEKRGAYYKLVEAQKLAELKEQEEEKQEAVDAEDDKLIRQASGTAKTEYVEDPDDRDLAAKLNRTQSAKSQSSLALQKRQKAATKKYSLWTLIKLIASFNTTEWRLMLVGLFFSIICGSGHPTQAVFFAKEIVTLSQIITPENSNQVLHDADFWCSMYLMLAFVLLLAFCVQGISFAFCSERLIHRVRDRVFRTLLRQDIAFFDLEENSAGALTSFLSTETTHVSGLSGTTLGTILTVLTTLIASITLSLAVGWKLALVTCSTIPVLLTCGFLRFWILAQFQRRAKRAYESSASYACEATSAIRTVASLTREGDVLQHYQASLAEQAARSLRSTIKSSSLYAASQSFMFLCMALGFWYGGTLIANGEYTLFQLFLCFPAIIFGAQSAGTIFSFARK
jgi:ATP-binding cassette, subfamily B (MDR/TAP), member 1